MKDLISPRQANFIDRSIAMQDPNSDEFRQIAFWARVCVQASLPHSDPGDVPVWGRENGRFSLTIQPGFDVRDGHSVNTGLPYGNIPRLLMSWMCTEAVRTKERRLFLGDSLSYFIREVGLGQATGGRWGNITRLKQQMQRLFDSRISYRWRGDDLSVRKSIPIANQEVIWWNTQTPGQSTLFQNYIVLSQEFFDEVTERPVPIKLEALRLLKQSSLALDLYTWLTYRVYRLERPVFISWAELQKQFGSDYKNPAEFARKCRHHIRRIKLVYPELSVNEHRGRLEIRPSPTHVIAA